MHRQTVGSVSPAPICHLVQAAARSMAIALAALAVLTAPACFDHDDERLPPDFGYADVGYGSHDTIDSGAGRHDVEEEEPEAPIDRRSCEHSLVTLVDLPAESTVRVARLGTDDLLFAADIHSGQLRWAWLADGPALDWRGGVDARCDSNLFAPCRYHLWVEPLPDGSVLVATRDPDGLVFYVVSDAETWSGPWRPPVPFDDDTVPLDVELDPAVTEYEGEHVVAVVAAGDRVAVLVRHWRSTRSGDEGFQRQEEALQVYWLSGPDGQFALESGPRRVERRTRAEYGHAVSLGAFHAAALGDEVAVWVYHYEEALRGYRLAPGGEVESLRADHLPEFARSLDTTWWGGRLYLGAVSAGGLWVAELDGAGNMSEPIEVIHPDGRQPSGGLNLTVDDDGLMVAGYLAGHEDNYVFHVTRFRPVDGVVRSAGVVAFSGGRFRHTLASPIAGGDEVYAFARTIESDDGAVHLLRGRCTLGY